MYCTLRIHLNMDVADMDCIGCGESHLTHRWPIRVLDFILNNFIPVLWTSVFYGLVAWFQHAAIHYHILKQRVSELSFNSTLFSFFVCIMYAFVFKSILLLVFKISLYIVYIKFIKIWFVFIYGKLHLIAWSFEPSNQSLITKIIQNHHFETQISITLNH